MHSTQKCCCYGNICNIEDCAEILIFYEFNFDRIWCLQAAAKVKIKHVFLQQLISINE